MKKALIALAAIAAIYGPLSAHADGLITFDGALTPETCTVTTSAGTNDFKQPMPYLPLGAVAGITNATVPASHATFSFTLSGCTGPATTAAAYFSGGNINANGRLSVPAGGATNVEVALLDEATNTTLNLAAGSGAQGATKVTINSSGATVLTYGAMYYIGAAAPTAGAINPQVYYAIDYR